MRARSAAPAFMAVDRDVFSAEVQRTLYEHPNVTVVSVDTLPTTVPPLPGH